MDDLRDFIARLARDDAQDVPLAVSAHYTLLFFSRTDPHALSQLPSIDVAHPPESYTPGTLVRFRAMVQDTSLQNEIYLARFPDGTCGGWGIHGDVDSEAIDPDRLRAVSVLWAVSVPGESLWRAAQFSPLDATGLPVYQPTLPHKFPIPEAPHVGVRVKIYDNAHIENLHSTDVVTFVGLTSSEFLVTDDDSSPEVPVLHVLCYQADSSSLTLTKMDPSVRSDLIDWISNEALGGDNDAAEWILLQLASKVHGRAIPLLPPSMTLSRFPLPPSPERPPTLSHVLAELLPQYIPIPLSLDLLNKTPFLPESKDEDLHSGFLQLPPGTTILLTESAIQEGKLLEKGIVNIRAIQDVMDSQTVDYIFPFSSKFTFHSDLSVIVLSEGRKSAFFQTTLNVPLRCTLATASLYKSKDEITLPSVEKMAVYRSYIAACRAVSEKVLVTGEASKLIQDDFVRRRQQDRSTTPDELERLVKVARLLAASQLQNEVTIDIWEQAKTLDGRRHAHRANAGYNPQGS